MNLETTKIQIYFNPEKTNSARDFLTIQTELFQKNFTWFDFSKKSLPYNPKYPYLYIGAKLSLFPSSTLVRADHPKENQRVYTAKQFIKAYVRPFRTLQIDFTNTPTDLIPNHYNSIQNWLFSRHFSWDNNANQLPFELPPSPILQINHYSTPSLKHLYHATKDPYFPTISSSNFINRYIKQKNNSHFPKILPPHIPSLQIDFSQFQPYPKSKYQLNQIKKYLNQHNFSFPNCVQQFHIPYKTNLKFLDIYSDNTSKRSLSWNHIKAANKQTLTPKAFINNYISKITTPNHKTQNITKKHHTPTHKLPKTFQIDFSYLPITPQNLKLVTKITKYLNKQNITWLRPSDSDHNPLDTQNSKLSITIHNNKQVMSWSPYNYGGIKYFVAGFINTFINTPTNTTPQTTTLHNLPVSAKNNTSVTTAVKKSIEIDPKDTPMSTVVRHLKTGQICGRWEVIERELADMDRAGTKLYKQNTSSVSTPLTQGTTMFILSTLLYCLTFLPKTGLTFIKWLHSPLKTFANIGRWSYCGTIAAAVAALCCLGGYHTWQNKDNILNQTQTISKTAINCITPSPDIWTNPSFSEDSRFAEASCNNQTIKLIRWDNNEWHHTSGEHLDPDVNKWIHSLEIKQFRGQDISTEKLKNWF